MNLVHVISRVLLDSQIARSNAQTVGVHFGYWISQTDGKLKVF